MFWIILTIIAIITLVLSLIFYDTIPQGTDDVLVGSSIAIGLISLILLLAEITRKVLIIISINSKKFGQKL